MDPSARGRAELMKRLAWLRRQGDSGALKWLPLTPAGAEMAGELRANLPVPKGHDPVGWTQDLTTAAIVWAAGFDIVTYNARDFETIAQNLPARTRPVRVLHPADLGL